MQSEHGASLVPAVTATVWEQGISTRIALFRNWSWDERKPHSVFLAGVQKLDGRVMLDVVDSASAFTVESVSAHLTEALKRLFSCFFSIELIGADGRAGCRLRGEPSNGNGGGGGAAEAQNWTDGARGA